MPIPIKPLGDKVLIKELQVEAQTASGIIIPDTAKEASQEYEVVAVGPGKYDKGELVPMDASIKVGAKILVSKYGGDEFKYEGEEYKLVGASDILAVVQK